MIPLSMLPAIRRSVLIAILALSAVPAGASTYYLSPAGNDSNDGTAARPWHTLTRAFQQGGSHTYVLQDGVYDYNGMEITAPPSGTATAWTIIKAQNDGQAMLRRSLFMTSASNMYIQFEGLRWKMNDEKTIVGRFLKFLRCSFEDGPLTASNVKNTSIGRIEGGAADVLMEDCLFFGNGGRYELLVYNSTRVVVRRCVIRHDGGWPGDGRDPEAGINFYNSTYCYAQNIIVLDSLASYAYWIAAFYCVNNPNGITYQTANVGWKGCLALSTKGLGFSAEGQGVISDINVEDSIFWDNQEGGMVFNGQDKPRTQVANVTIGNSRQPNIGSGRGIAYFNPVTPIPVKNAIVRGKTEAFQAVQATYYDCFANGGCSGSSTGRQTYDPYLNGLTHLDRIDPGTRLAQDGEGGARIGATMTTRIGVSGTLYGETGWNVDTGQPLWPWPYEARARSERCASTSTGFCAASSLTAYVCSYLGNGCGDTTPPAAPTNVTATAQSSTQIRADWNASTDNVAVTGYRLDVSTTPTFSSFIAGYQNRDLGNVTTAAVPGLSPSTTYYVRLRAYDAAGNISSNSPTASATPSAGNGETTTRVIAVGNTWRYFKGSTAAPSQWTAAEFDDGAWLSGPTGIGYGDNDDATVLADMQNSYWSVYARKTFTVGNPSGVTGMSLVIDWDDGFVAYLNGTEVARSNMPAGTPQNTTPASSFHEAGTPTSFDLSPYSALLVAGRNVLAIEVHNDELASSDLSLLPSLDVRSMADIWSPTEPSNVTATSATADALSVSWSASTDNVAVTGYRIDVSTASDFGSYVTGQHDRDLGNVTATTVSGLAGGTRYYVRLRAYDAAGNISPNSSTASATTPAGSTTVRVISVGDVWKYAKGTAAPPATWRDIAFDDSAWLGGATGLGYGDGDDATLLSDMQNSYISVYARKTFTVADAAAVVGLRLVIDWDDGYVAYLNGTEVARANMTGTPSYNTPASSFHEVGAPATVDLSAFRNLLVNGTNVLAIEVHNDDIASSDLSLLPALDLRIPDPVIRAGDVWRYFKGTSAPPASWAAAGFDDSSWSSGPTGIGYGDGDDATVLSDMQNGYISLFARRAFTIADATAVTGLWLTIDFDDGFVAYLNGTEVARSNMPAGVPQYTTAASPFHEAGTPVLIDLTAYRSLLVSGTNVLAIEVHNDDIASSDLSLIPVLGVER
jgi:chitodextrinase